MGGYLARNRHHEEEMFVRDGEIYRLWSYNCTSGGRYVSLTDKRVSEGFEVKATGEVNGIKMSLTDITFHRTTVVHLEYELQFDKNNTFYSAQASENGMTASEGNSDTLFKIIELWKPNKPYIVLRSNKKVGGKHLYLSSDGAGDLRLKVWNERRRNTPPRATSQVDPAFLFRLVRPEILEAEED